MAVTLMMGEKISIRVDEAVAKSLAAQLHAAGFGRHETDVDDGREVFDDGHVIWRRHTGGSSHSADPEWQPRDIDAAEAYFAAVRGKARTFLDLLIDRPGERLSTEEIRRLAPGVFGNAHSIAGSVKGLARPQRECGRRYPFYWWQERPTRYGMKPSVAELFDRARARVGG